MKITINLPELADPQMMVECINHSVALELSKTGEYSLGYCAHVAGISYEDFMLLLGEKKIPMFTKSQQELLDDLSNA